MREGIVADLDELLAKESWALRLARALVRDEDDAQDVVQEARVVAWRRPPDDVSKARSWLVVVLRNLARNRNRAESRHVAAVAAAARESATSESAETIGERLEAHRTLAELVAALREPYREAVVLRYYDGLSAADIGRKLDLPAGTIRWRLKQGLDELRARLDVRHGGAWVPLMMTLAGPTQPTQADASTPPVTLAWRLVYLAFGIVAAAGIATMLSWSTMPVREGTAKPGPVLAAAAATPRDPREGRVTQLPPHFASLEGHGKKTDPPGEAPVPTWALAEGFPARVVAGRVLASGKPVAGAEVRLSAGMFTFARHMDRHARTGVDGRFAFPPQPPTNWFLTVSAPDVEPAIRYVDLRGDPPPLVHGRPPNELLLELGACALIRGTVHEQDGGPIANATVRLAASWNNGGVHVTTSASGHYELCAPGTKMNVASYILVAAASGYATIETLSPREGGVVDFALGPEATVAGRTLRDPDGAFLGGVKVTLQPTGDANPNNTSAGTFQRTRLETSSDTDGVFEFAGVADGQYHVEVAADGYRHKGAAQPLVVRPGSSVRDRELRLIQEAIVEGFVSRGAQHVADASIWFKARDAAGSWYDAGWTLSLPDGRFRVRLPLGATVERILTPPPPGTNGDWPRALAPERIAVDRPRQTGVLVELPPWPRVAD